VSAIKGRGEKGQNRFDRRKKLFYFCLFEEFLLRCSVGASEQQKSGMSFSCFFYFRAKKRKKNFFNFLLLTPLGYIQLVLGAALEKKLLL
jgi:hypothetical protein